MTDPTKKQPTIIPVEIEKEMKTAYLDYSVSVIISRAIPDTRDGLKPSQRRVLYAMAQLNLTPGAKHRKCAKICGDTSGDYHPHGETTIYPTLTRMAPDWLMRYPLVDGQGNFGSIDGDEPAAMRYTEARLTKTAADLLTDIEKQTVPFIPNYDSTKEEPTIFPGKFPNLLCNGSSGIAVGMATNMAPHNLTEVANAIEAYIDNHDITIEELMEQIQAPDFPTGGIIYGYQGVRDAFLTGKGRIVVRGVATIEQNKKPQIIVTELPYMVNKAKLIEKTIQMVNDKTLQGIADLRDESDKDGMRIVYDLKKEAIPSIVLNNLYKRTDLQTTFNVNNVALVKGKPKLLNLKHLVQSYVEHRHEIIVNRTIYEQKQAQQQLHLLDGYLIALDHLDPVIKLIKAAKNPTDAKEALIATYHLSQVQAKAILDMKLQRLTGLEREKIIESHQTTKALLENLEAILADRSKRMDLLKQDLIYLKTNYKDSRKTTIEHNAEGFVAEDMIPNLPAVITLSEHGYIKRSPLDTYKVQNRGGIGAKGATTKKEDFLSQVFIAHAHNYLLIFTQSGRLYWKKVYEVPESAKTTQGRAIQNILNIPSDDSIQSIVKVENLHDPTYLQNRCIILCTEKGIVKKTPLAAFKHPRSLGIRAITFREGDRLLEAKLTTQGDDIILATKSGQATRFPETEVRPMGRGAAGVKGITLAPHDKVVGMVSAPAADKQTMLLVVASKGYGKRSPLSAYRLTKRGGKGVKTLNVTPTTGELVAIKEVTKDDDLMIMNASGTAIRISLSTLRSLSRYARGVRLLRLRPQDTIAAVAVIKEINPTSADKP